MKIFLALSLLLLSANNSLSSELNYFLVGAINQATPCKQKTFLLKKGDTLKLYLVLYLNNTFFAPIDSFYSNGDLLKVTKPIPPQIRVSWNQIQPKLQEYSNLWIKGNIKKGHIHIEPIQYEKLALNDAAEQFSLDFSRIMHSDHLGTYYVSVEVPFEGKIVNKIDATFSETSPLNQINPFKTVQIVYRQDDSYIGLLTELLNTPFIIAPKVTSDGFHESDSRMGSDCAAFAIYGKRRQGYKIPYCGPKRIYNYLKEIENGPLRPKKAFGTEVYTNTDGQFIQIDSNGLKQGDIIHFGEQVSVFYEDSGLKGFLDKDDLLFQCYGTTPHIITIKKSGFYHKPIKLFKWKND